MLTLNGQVTLSPSTMTQPGQTLTLISTVIEKIKTCNVPTATGAAAVQATAKLDPKSDRTWGCAPSYNCNPPMPDSCDLYSNPPDDEYLCEPQYCKPIGDYLNVTWKTNETSYYQLTEGYFVLNPEAFGLSFDIFSEDVIIEVANGKTTTVTTGNWASQTSITDYTISGSSSPTSSAEASATTDLWWTPKRSNVITKRTMLLKKRDLDESTIPAVCYSECQNAFSEVQKIGKTTSLCSSTSVFSQEYQTCLECISKNGASSKVTGRSYVTDTFSQYVDYCKATDANPASTSSGPAADLSTSADVVTSSQETGGASSLIILTSSTTSESSSESSSPSATSTSGKSSSSVVSTSVVSTSASLVSEVSGSTLSSSAPSASTSSASGTSGLESSTATSSGSGSSALGTSAPSASSGQTASSTPTATGSPTTTSSAGASAGSSGTETTLVPSSTKATGAGSSASGAVTAGAARLRQTSGPGRLGALLPVLAWLFFLL